MTAGGGPQGRAETAHRAPRRRRHPVVIRARRHSIYCSPAEWAEMTGRARSAGMRTSPLVIACALADDGDERPDTLLALSEEEQRTQYDRIALLDRWARAMYARLPGCDFSMFEALAFLERAASLRRVPRQ